MNENESSAPVNWHQRAEQFQEQEWALAQQLLALGRRSLLNYLGQLKATTSLAQVEKILRLAHKIGQISSQLAAAKQDSDSMCPECCAHRLEVEAALTKIFGPPLPGEANKAETVLIPSTSGLPVPKPNGSSLSTLNSQPSTN
jgi:hypothetical protein